MLRTQNQQIEPQLNVAIYGYDKNKRRVGVYQGVVNLSDLSEFSNHAKSAFINMQRSEGVKPMMVVDRAFVVILGGKA